MGMGKWDGGGLCSGVWYRGVGGGGIRMGVGCGGVSLIGWEGSRGGGEWRGWGSADGG